MSYQVPRKKKQAQQDPRNRIVVTKSGKRTKKVAIPIKGLGTFYVTRKWVALSALASVVALFSLTAFLYWLWVYRIPAVTSGG